ncbi:oxygen-independent coproporphyrinogen III oxidase [Uliginosibacterium paludis]|uniref:Coproporphyrinogen-III oxidase n=1 Tax=Uliginosibacterium paludis TaxID=1615952 RepID=A0ABV2CK65_9RHOO
MQQTIIFDPDLIRRFDIPGPRYTSYPTADRFLQEFEQHAKADSLKTVVAGVKSPLSLYFHIPFCNTICYYCACNKIITKDRSLSERYISYLEKEMALQAALLPQRGVVTQMHWGGGTPTFLSQAEIRRLMASIRSHFELAEEGEFSIEVDPRKVTSEVVAQLASEGFNRMSVGVQDFDPRVQAAVNRIQSVDETHAVIAAARAEGFQSISVDLIYGLPHQNVERFATTLNTVLGMRPDRIALYNYAHLPTRFMPQRRINEADLPPPDEKLRILALAIERLDKAGYVYIGMDHFARPDDELAVAQRSGRLQRNFQGYSTHAECDLLAFGVSSIGKAGGAFSQNHRDLEPYYAALDRNELPVLRGWALSEDDNLRNAVIQTLMCDFELTYEIFNRRYGIDFVGRFEPELQELAELAAAGLLDMDKQGIRVTDAGRMLVRIVAMVFDRYLRSDREKRRYSRVI